MRVLRHSDPDFSKQLAGLQRKSEPTPEVEKTVREIITAIRARGNAALLEFTARFGGPKLSAKQLLVTGRPPSVAVETERAVAASHANVLEFATRSLRKNWSAKNAQGAVVGERFDPFQRVGIYVPGGTAPLVSTAIMTVTLAAAAGVPEIVVATPSDAAGKVNEALLYALHFAGATEIYQVGGAQAIAALAYGTETIPPVLKIFGPGNAYVVEAKRQVFGQVAVDLLPGPSEILVLADATANPAWVAADLLAQAEHGKNSSILFVTNSAKLLKAVEAQITAQLGTLSRQEHLAPVLEKDCALILVKSLKDAVRIANDFAPEHISIVAAEEEKLATEIRTSGAIFVGGYSPVAAGDFLAGPSHELPTGGAGKSFPGLTVDQFQRRTSIVRFDRKALQKSLETISTFSAVEGLDAHGRSATIRLE
ncbi:MAG TPA: histidinol dehydrogenase [Chthoniobacteraceae bacterium]|jgi:histidinol dehydrogenase